MTTVSLLSKYSSFSRNFYIRSHVQYHDKMAHCWFLSYTHTRERQADGHLSHMNFDMNCIVHLVKKNSDLSSD